MNLGTIFATLKIFDEMSPALKVAGYQLTNFGQGMTHVGVLASGMSLAIVGVAKEVVTLGSEFEHSTTKLVSLAGVTKDELEGVRQHLLNLAPAVGLGPGALSEAMYTVSSTMGDTAEAIKVLDTATLGAMIGMGKAKDVAGALTSVVLAYGKETITAARAGDILTRVIRDGGAEAHELAPRLAKVVPFAAQLGISFEEVGANIATMTKIGVPASQAVTSLASVFAALARAVPRGQKALAEVGMTYAGLRAEIKEKGLAEALIRLRGTFKDNEEGLIDVVGRLEALKDVLGTTGPMAETYRRVLDNIKNSQGELAESADVTRESLQFQWEALQASIEVVWIEIANSFLPILKEAVQLFHATLPPLLSMIDAFSGFPDWVKMGALALVGFLAILGPGLMIIGQMGVGVGYLMRGVQFFQKETIKLTTIVTQATAAERTAAISAGIHADAQIAAAKVMDTKAKMTLAAANATKLLAIAEKDAVASAALNAARGGVNIPGMVGFQPIAPARLAAAEKAALSAANAEKAVAASMKASAAGAKALANAQTALAASNAVTAATTGAVITSTNAATGAFARLFAVLRAHPFIAITSAIAAVAGVIWLMKEKTELNTDALYQSADGHAKDIEKLIEMKKELNANVGASTGLEGIKKKLLSISPSYLSSLSTEGAYYNQLDFAIDKTLDSKKEMLAFDLVTAETSRDVLVAKREAAAAELKIAETRKMAPKEEYQAFEGVPFLVTMQKTTEEILRQTEAEIKARDAWSQARDAVEANETKIEAYRRVLIPAVKATYEAAKAQDILNLTLKELAKGDTPQRIAAGLALWAKGMKLAELSQKDFEEAQKDSAKMTIFVAGVTRALGEEESIRTGKIVNLKEATKALTKAEKLRKDIIEDEIKLREKMASDTKKIQDQILAIEGDIAAKRLALNGETYEAEIQRIENTLTREINAVDDSFANYQDKQVARVRLEEQAALAILLVEDRRVKKQIEILDKYFSAHEQGLSRIEALEEKTISIRSKLGGDNLESQLALNRKAAIEAEANNKKSLDKQLKDLRDSLAMADFWKDIFSRLAIARSKKEGDAIKAAQDAADDAAKYADKIKKQNELNHAVEEFISLLNQIGDASGGEFGRMMHFLSGVATAWVTATKAAQAYKDALEKGNKAAQAQALMQGIGSIISATGSGSTASRVVGGAVSGAVLGKVIPGIGPAVGGIVGGLVGLVRGLTDTTKALAEWQAQLARVAANDELRKSLNETYGSAARVAALFKAIGVENIQLGDTTYIAKLKMDQLNATIGRLTTEMNEIASSTRVATAELIAFRDAVPTDSIVMTFVLQQVQAAGSSVQSMIGNMQSSATAIATKKIREEIAILQEQIRVAEAAGRGSSSDNDITGDWRTRLKLLEEMRDATIGTIKITKGGAMAMAAILIASYDGTAASLRAMAPALATLQAAMKASGIEGSAAFNNILALSKLATDEITGPMIDAINNGAAALVAMYNSGFLTQEVFSGMLGEIQAQRQALLDNGATLEQVNQIMAPSLQKIWELWKTGKYKVDDVTRAQLEAAQAAGTVGDKHRSATDRMVLALERLADMFETVFADKLEDAAKRGAAAAQRAIDGIKGRVVVVDVEYKWPGQTGGPGGGGTGSGGGQGGGGNIPPGFAGGTRGRYIDFGSGTNAVLHGRERIMTEEEGRAANRGDQTIEVSMGEEVIIRKVVRGMPRVMRLKGYM